MGFGRLAIMGLTPEGIQPFYRGADCVVCNGELYGFRFEKEILKRRGYKFCSDCDCEILLPLYYEYGLDMFRHMDAEFALIMYDSVRTGSSPPATPSASVRCSTATPSPATRSPFPPRCATSSAGAMISVPSPLAATTATAALCATRTLRTCLPPCRTISHPEERIPGPDRRCTTATYRGLSALRRLDSSLVCSISWASPSAPLPCGRASTANTPRTISWQRAPGSSSTVVVLQQRKRSSVAGYMRYQLIAGGACG